MIGKSITPHQRHQPSSGGVYVDDILAGLDSISEAQQLKLELIELMKSAGYELRKWSSNCKELLEDLPQDHWEQPRQFDNEDKSFIKVLGIQWNPVSDSFSYEINIPMGEVVTKRQIHSTIEDYMIRVVIVHRSYSDSKYFFSRYSWMELDGMNP